MVIIDHIPLYHIPQYLQVGCEGALLVRVSPGARAAVVVVGEDVVVVDVEAGQQRGARGAAHGRGGVAAPVHRARLAHVPPQLRHELQRPELHILVTGMCVANVIEISYNNK